MKHQKKSLNTKKNSTASAQSFENSNAPYRHKNYPKNK